MSAFALYSKKRKKRVLSKESERECETKAPHLTGNLAGRSDLCLALSDTGEFSDLEL